MKDKIVIIGASGHGKVVADIAKLNGYQEIVFVDDDINKKNVDFIKLLVQVMMFQNIKKDMISL